MSVSGYCSSKILLHSKIFKGKALIRLFTSKKGLLYALKNNHTRKSCI